MNLSGIFENLSEKKRDKNDRILIVDGTNSFCRVFACTPQISENGEHIGGILGFLRSIGSNIRDFNPSRCIVVFDGKGGSVRRKKLFPDYKQNRSVKKNPTKIEFATVEDEYESMRKQMMRIVQYLSLLPVQIFCIDNIEADDVIAYLTMQYFGPKGSKIRIVSTDRDFLQLVSENVEVYSPVKKKIYQPKELVEEFGIHPDNYLLYRIVDGDTGDNIPGVNGIGLKTLLKHFPEISEKPIDFAHLLSESEAKVDLKKAPKIFQTILDYKKELERNFDLMQLQDIDIALSTKLKMINLIEQPVPKIDKMKFRKFIVEDYLTDQFKNVDNWLLMTFNSLNAASHEKEKDE